MGRWEPDAAGRLRVAALELYAEQGYERTTVAEIADRAGVTARTFFRHFADKREVLFAGSEDLQAALVDAVTHAPDGSPPLAAVQAALSVAATLLGGNREWSRTRQQVIDATPELRERELSKLDALTTALGHALVTRGVDTHQARVAAEAGMVAFRIGFGRWVSGEEPGDLDALMRAGLDDLSAALVTGGRRPSARTSPPQP